jgi:SAM-dependent methyltransferase
LYTILQNIQAEETGLNRESIDGLICCLTIHHWTDLNIAFKEIHRILKKNGRFVIFTSTPDQMEGYWLNHYFPQMLYESRQQMPSLEIVIKELENTGFDKIKIEKYFVSQDLQDCFLYCGKQRPELYLKPEIRNGISSFADLANKVEVEYGLFELAKDIDNGNIKSIIDRYENEKGDYIFIIGTKASG